MVAEEIIAKPIYCSLSEETMTMEEDEASGKRSYRDFCLGG